MNALDLLPDGWYSARISSAIVKTTKAGNGKYINICYEIIGHPDHAFFGMVTLDNPRESMARKGREELRRIKLACGIDRLTDVEQLVNCELQVLVGTKRSDKYGDKNIAKDYLPASALSR